MYENRYGRFTAVDPLLASGKSGNPQTFNRYVYVLNNPVIYRDPDGLQVAVDEVIHVNTIWSTKLGKYVEQANNYLRYLAGMEEYEGDQIQPGTQFKEIYTPKGPIPRFVKPGEPVGNAIQSGNQAMADFDELVIQRIPLFSNLVNAQKAGINDDGLGVLTETSLFGLDLGTTVFSGGTASTARRALAQNLAKEGIERPLNSATHHIVAIADKRASQARAILEKAGIDINDAVNGVFLPMTKKFSNLTGSKAHTQIHTNAYYETLTNRLMNTQNVREELKLIQKEILEGIFAK